MPGNVVASAISHERPQNAERDSPNEARDGQEFANAAQQARNGCLIGVADEDFHRLLTSER